MTTSEIRNAFNDKVRRGMFSPVARHLYVDTEDRLQEGIALTWAWYSPAAQRGHAPDDALLVHHCHVRAMDLSRQLASDGTQRKRDALDPRNSLDGTLELFHLDSDGIEGVAPHGVVGFAEATSHNPTTRIVSAINLDRWLAELEEEDRSLLELRASGHTLNEIGQRLGLSTSAVFGRCKSLGLQLAEHAQVRLRRDGEPKPAWQKATGTS